MSSGDANVTIEVKVEEGSGGKRGQLIVRGQSVHKAVNPRVVILTWARYWYRNEQGGAGKELGNDR